jgi:hypothetical protein
MGVVRIELTGVGLEVRISAVEILPTRKKGEGG